ncbi:tryptophan synthase subunit alpha [Clostridia bacterium]|nr:tryptophan synthase subunit alpha [Clostridia bacterium]
MDRIANAFARSKKENKHLLIGYVTAGDPAIGDTVALASKMMESGVGLLEFGLPYSDPLADGPLLQEAATRSLKNGTTPDTVFSMVKSLREDSDKPIVLLVYYNTILNYGEKQFANQCKKCGVDGLVVPDLPMEHREGLVRAIHNTNKEGPVLSLVPLVSEHSHERIETIVKGMSGFVYCVSYSGVTGKQGCFDQKVVDFLQEVRSYTDLPLAVGFGIRTKKDVDYLSQYANGIIVGTGIMRKAVDEGTEKVVEYIRTELV